MPASASGVSTQRSGPNSSSRPSVARKTPPRLATSSPSTITESSRAISWRSPSFTACDERPHGHVSVSRRRVAVAAERARRQRVGRVEDLPSGRDPAGIPRSRSPSSISASASSPDLADRPIVEHAELPQLALEAAEALPLSRRPELRRVHVAAGVVGGGVGRAAEGDRLDELRPFAGARPRCRLRARRRAPRGRRRRRPARPPSRSRPPCRRGARRRTAPPSGSRSPRSCCCRRRPPGPAWRTAKVIPSWNAPVEVAPSPKKQRTQVRSPRSRRPHAIPAAWGTWLPTGTAIDAIRHSRGFHQPPGCPRHQESTCEAGMPAEQADGRLAIGREDPVVRPRARGRRRPAAPRGPRRSRRSRSGPGGGRRPSGRRRCAGGPCCDRGRSARPAGPDLLPGRSRLVGYRFGIHSDTVPLGPRSYPRSTRATRRGTRYGERARRRQPSRRGSRERDPESTRRDHPAA